MAHRQQADHICSVDLHFQEKGVADNNVVVKGILDIMLVDVQYILSSITSDASRGIVTARIKLESRKIQHEAMKRLREKKFSDVKIVARVMKTDGGLCPPEELDKFIQRFNREVKKSESKHRHKVLEVEEKMNGVKGNLEIIQGSVPKKAVEVSSWKLKQQSQYEELKALLAKKSELIEQQWVFVSKIDQLREKVDSDLAGSGSDWKKCLNSIDLEFNWELKALESALPILAYRFKILDMVRDHQVCLIKAETGSGKSTQIVQYLYRSGFVSGEKKVVCTQPRKIAASSLSERVTNEMMIGGLVGHRLMARGSNRRCRESILFLTDAQLLRHVSDDPILTDFSCVVVDEAHERSLHTDLLLGILKGILKKRNDLKVVVTSATLDTQRFLDFFPGCPLALVPGRTFPVDVFWVESSDVGEKIGGDYLHKAVEKAAWIHHNEPEGDILVFLATPQDTEKAKEMLENKLAGNKVQVLQLHGRLQQHEQHLVFDSPRVGYRKVVFSTNSAETSLTIPGIVYVVDAGMAKECRYNAMHNTSSLVLGPINRSSAEQRKGRAGRMTPGKCFRLYSKEDYEAMEEAMVPEIRRTHLGHAILRLVQLGVSKPLKFDFLERPSEDALEAAMSSLTSLGALAYSPYGGVVMTAVGRDLVKLPLPPPLGHVLLRALEREEGRFEALSCVCLLGALSGAVFFRAGSEELIQEADSRRMPFCQSSGDLMTSLEVFSTWWQQPDEQAKRKWCGTHYVNGKSMKAARELMKEVVDVLRQEFNIIIEHSYNNDIQQKMMICNFVCCLLAETQVKNLCVYRGNPRMGYILVDNCDIVKMHPSSSFSYLGKHPQFIVFDQVLKTSQDFMHGVNEVKQEWVERLLMEGKVSREKLDRAQALCVLTKKYRIGSCFLIIIKDVKAELNQILASGDNTDDGATRYNLDFSKVKGILKIDTTASTQSIIQPYLDKALMECKEQVLSKQRRHPLAGLVHITLIFGSGGILVDVLLPGDFLAIDLESVPPETTDTDVKKYFPEATSISTSEVVREGESSARKMHIKFRSVLEAKTAFHRSSNLPYKIKPHGVRGGPRLSAVCILHVGWARRKCTGRGNIKFTNVVDFFNARSCPPNICVTSAGGVTSMVKWKISFKEPNCIFIPGGLHPLTTNEDLTEAVKKWFFGEFEEAPNVYVQSDRSDETPEMAKRKLESLIEWEEESDTLVEVYGGERSLRWKGRVYINDPSLGPELFSRLSSINGVDMGLGICVPFTCKLEMQADHYCSKRVYNSVKEEVESMLQEMKKLFGKDTAENLRVEDKEMRNGETMCLKIIASNNSLLGRASYALGNILCGEHFPYVGKPILATLVESLEDSNDGLLKKVQLDTSTTMQVDSRKKLLMIFGTKTAISKATCEINKIMDSIGDEGVKEEVIVVTSGTIIRSLLAQQGPTLPEVAAKATASKVRMQLYPKPSVHVIGNPDSIQKVRQMVSELESQVQDRENGETEDDLECGICFTPAEKCTSLNVCGHVYCAECVQSQMEACDLPLKCAREECREDWAVKDIFDILGKLSKDAEEKLTRTALEKLIGIQNQDSNFQLKHCPSPNCTGLFRTSMHSDGNGARWRCPFCSNMLCTRCKVLFHHGMTCSDYACTLNDEDYMFKKWLREDPDNRKLCPVCKTYVEKIDGCNHMNCGKCSAHFCWRCLIVKPTGGEIYAHQPFCRGDVHIQ